MNCLLIRSDDLTIRSDEYPESASNSSAQTSPQTGARLAPARAGVTRFADRDLQALRSAELPLRGRTGTRSEAISRHQSAWRAAPQRLRPECSSRARCPSDLQLPQAARGAQRDLRDQCRTPAPARGSRVDRHGPGPHRPRLRQSGGRPRRHGCVLSLCWRLAVRSGEGR